MADEPQSAAPQGLETKDAPVAGGRDSVIEHRTAGVPHQNMTGSQLTDAARKASFAAVGSPAQGDGVQNADTVGLGVATEDGGTQETPAVGSSQNEGTTARRRKS